MFRCEEDLVETHQACSCCRGKARLQTRGTNSTVAVSHSWYTGCAFVQHYHVEMKALIGNFEK